MRSAISFFPRRRRFSVVWRLSIRDRMPRGAPVVEIRTLGLHPNAARERPLRPDPQIRKSGFAPRAGPGRKPRGELPDAPFAAYLADIDGESRAEIARLLHVKRELLNHETGREGSRTADTYVAAGRRTLHAMGAYPWALTDDDREALERVVARGALRAGAACLVSLGTCKGTSRPSTQAHTTCGALQRADSTTLERSKTTGRLSTRLGVGAEIQAGAGHTKPAMWLLFMVS